MTLSRKSFAEEPLGRMVGAAQDRPWVKLGM